MCVIIQRQPNVEIPFDKLASACVVNPDGWGVAIADRGKLELRHGLEKTTDPEKIMKILEDAKTLPVMLHLRYVTQGAKSLENCHPFWSLTRDEHGVDLAFCHNGTLSDWKENDSDYSDSYWINQKLITPLFQRTAAFVGKENILRDEFSISLLEEMAGYSSLFGLIDGSGTQLAINGDKGKEFEGWWASNEYSFNERHRTKTTSYSHHSCTTTGEHYSSAYPDDPVVDPWNGWEKDLQADDEKVTKVFLYVNGKPMYHYYRQDGTLVKEEEAKPVIVPPEDPSYVEDTEDEIADMVELLDQGEDIKKVFDMHEKKMSQKLIKHCTAKQRPKFTEVCKIDDLREVTRLDPEDIAELVSFYPEAATVLIQDLLAELYFKTVAGARTAVAQAAAENLAKRKAEKAA